MFRNYGLENSLSSMNRILALFWMPFLKERTKQQIVMFSYSTDDSLLVKMILEIDRNLLKKIFC